MDAKPTKSRLVLMWPEKYSKDEFFNDLQMPSNLMATNAFDLICSAFDGHKKHQRTDQFRTVWSEETHHNQVSLLFHKTVALMEIPTVIREGLDKEELALIGKDIEASDHPIKAASLLRKLVHQHTAYLEKMASAIVNQPQPLPAGVNSPLEQDQNAENAVNAEAEVEPV